MIDAERMRELMARLQRELDTLQSQNSWFDTKQRQGDILDLLAVLDDYAALKAEVSDQKKALDLCGYIIEPIQKERDALKAENEKLRTRDNMLVNEVSAWAKRSVKAEAELERQRPLIEAVMGHAPWSGEDSTTGDPVQAWPLDSRKAILRAALKLREGKGK